MWPTFPSLSCDLSKSKPDKSLLLDFGDFFRTDFGVLFPSMWLTFPSLSCGLSKSSLNTGLLLDFGLLLDLSTSLDSSSDLCC